MARGVLRKIVGRTGFAVVALIATFHDALAQTLPVGFSATRLFATTTLNAPTALAFIPDGRMLITLQGGNLRVAQNGVVASTPALSLGTKVCSTSERGLLGVAVDPQFSNNNFVYLYYTFRKFPNAGDPCLTGQPTSADNPVNRVSRFVLPGTNVIDPQSEVILIDNIPSPNGNHNGGDLHFGKDGLLYISVGDGGADYAGDSGSGGSNDAARDKHKLLGKILRIDRNGGIPATNPFQGAGSGRCNLTGGTTPGNHCQETYAWGLRNPFRFAMDGNAAGVRFFINDVGQDNWEEIDDGQIGADYGWNCREGRNVNSSSGPCNPVPAGMIDPIFEYAHGASIPGTTSPSSCDAITGGAFVPAGIWPISNGTYLAADFTCGVIFQMSMPAATWVASNFVSGLGSSSATSLSFGPYGNTQGLYYTTYAGGGQIWVIAYQASAVELTFNTTPAGLGVRVNGQPINDGQVVTAWPGSALLVQAPPQRPALQNYYFSNWSDAGASTHTITTPAAPAGYTATFATLAPASADADANGQYEALTDGLLILRHMFGLSDATLVAGALGPNALHDTPAAVAGFLDSTGLALDIDLDGKVDALTDGLLILRYLSGMRGTALVEGVVAAGAMRVSSGAIETYMTSLLR